MIVRTLISFVVILILFAMAVKHNVIHYAKVAPDYFIKAERFVYNDTVQDLDIVMVGTSLSAHYHVANLNYSKFQNLSMTGRCAIDGIGVINGSGKYPKVLLIETNLFDNNVDSVMLQKVFYPLMTDLKKNGFFLQREYKLHNTIPDVVYNLNEKIVASIATKTKLYSLNAKLQSDANVNWLENHIRQHNIQFHSTIADTLSIYNRYLLLKKHVQHLQAKGIKVILFETPVVNAIAHSERTAYKHSLMVYMAKELSLPYVSAPNIEQYQPYLAKGDGIHMSDTGIKAYSQFLSDTVYALLSK